MLVTTLPPKYKHARRRALTNFHRVFVPKTPATFRFGFTVIFQSMQHNKSIKKQSVLYGRTHVTHHKTEDCRWVSHWINPKFIALTFKASENKSISILFYYNRLIVSWLIEHSFYSNFYFFSTRQLSFFSVWTVQPNHKFKKTFGCTNFMKNGDVYITDYAQLILTIEMTITQLIKITKQIKP